MWHIVHIQPVDEVNEPVYVVRSQGGKLLMGKTIVHMALVAGEARYLNAGLATRPLRRCDGQLALSIFGSAL